MVVFEYITLIVILIFKFYYGACYSFMPSAAGPFKAYATNVENCLPNLKPIEANPPLATHVEMYNGTEVNMIRGNVTIFRNCSLKRLQSRVYQWQEGKYKLVNMLHNIGCNSILMPFLTLITGVKYDGNTCTYFKGNYSFGGIKLDKAIHMIHEVHEYGRITWRLDLKSQYGAYVFCWDIATIIEPISKQ